MSHLALKRVFLFCGQHWGKEMGISQDTEIVLARRDEEDTFDVPPWIVDPHDIYFISRGDGTGKVCRLGKGDFGPVRSPNCTSHSID